MQHVERIQITYGPPVKTCSRHLKLGFPEICCTVYCILFYNQYRQSIRCEVVRLAEIRAFNTKKDYYTAV